MKVSIIIPTLNEAENIERLIDHLDRFGGDQLQEIIVVDGGSTDETCLVAQKRGAIVLNSPGKGRAMQMNFGVQNSLGEVLYFVHGDTLPPKSYMSDIQQTLGEGFESGIFRFRFESDRPILKVNSWFTRFDFLWCRGGDQSIFTTRQVFEKLGGYRCDYLIMEDYDFIIRTRKSFSFKIIQKDTLVSARKYETNSYFRVQIANLIVFNMYRLGYSQEKMIETYYRLLNYRYGRKPYKDEKVKVRDKVSGGF